MWAACRRVSHSKEPVRVPDVARPAISGQFRKGGGSVRNFRVSCSVQMDIAALNAMCPLRIPQAQFIQNSAASLNGLGFTRNNSLPIVATCRDELAMSALRDIDEAWRSPRSNSGVSFSMAALGGMILLGRQGMRSAISHAPKDKYGRTRFIFYAFPHVGVHNSGCLGHIRRVGLDEDSSVCGALMGVREELMSGWINYEMDPLDYEYCQLKHRILSNIEYGEQPTISELTMIAYKVVVKDLEMLIKEVTKDIPTFDYAVFSGIQVHTPQLETEIWPGKCYAVKDNQHHDLSSAFTK